MKLIARRQGSFGPVVSSELDMKSVVQMRRRVRRTPGAARSEEHTSELQSLRHLVCRLLLEKKKKTLLLPLPRRSPGRPRPTAAPYDAPWYPSDRDQLQRLRSDAYRLPPQSHSSSSVRCMY